MFLCLNFLVARSGALFSNCDPCSSNTSAGSSFVASLEAASSFGLWVDLGCGISNRKIVCRFGITRRIELISPPKTLGCSLDLTLEFILLRDDLERKLRIPDHNPSQSHHSHTSTPHNRNLRSMVIRTSQQIPRAVPRHKRLLVHLHPQYLPHVSHPHLLQRHIYLVLPRRVRDLVDTGVPLFLGG